MFCRRSVFYHHKNAVVAGEQEAIGSFLLQFGLSENCRKILSKNVRQKIQNLGLKDFGENYKQN